MTDNKDKSAVDIKKLEAELLVAKEEAAKNLAGWQRARADYSNLQKETEKRSGELIEFANAAFMSEVLPVYGHFKMAMKHVPEAQQKENWVIGLGHIKNQFQGFLKKYNIEEIKTVGEKFDPNLHEAVAHEVKEGFASDMIFEEFQPGYVLGDKVIMPAKVRVAK